MISYTRTLCDELDDRQTETAQKITDAIRGAKNG